MKLLKGLFAIVLISMIAVSCSGEKKDADATKENIETVADKDIDATDSKMAAHVCDENCTKENCPMMKKMANHKCDENCKAGNCPMHAGEKKCDSSKCSADCTGKDCAKCAAKKAE